MPIRVLPLQLANQIAAGEVVERPASVVKELLENSLDAGASRIEIDIEQGGAKRISIRDNGYGIAKEELTLALARHATSKIVNLDDLESITSMGFRGEALSSLSSVSRLTLISRIVEQNEAWQVYAEGSKLAVSLKPVAHPVGTTVEVLDLFYNTPARRKFMRTEKTEFIHIDDVIRRIALARFDVTLTLQHNGKMVRQYRAVRQHLCRLCKVFGPKFVEQALGISWHYGDLAIHGWVIDPREGGLCNNMQYSYVNQRMIRNNLINHAIRQAYHEQMAGIQPAFVLFLEVQPHQVDVNVHPAKHEVRFHQARLVHDFIHQSVVTALQKSKTSGYLIDKKEIGYRIPMNPYVSGRNCFSFPAAKVPSILVAQQAKIEENFQLPVTPVVCEKMMESPVVIEDIPFNSKADIAGNSKSFGRVLTLVGLQYALVQSVSSVVLISLPVIKRYLTEYKLMFGIDQMRLNPLFVPLHMRLCDKEVAVLKRYQSLLQEIGIELQADFNRVILHAVPVPLLEQNLQDLIPDLLGYLDDERLVTHHKIAIWLSKRQQSNSSAWNHSRAVELLGEVERFCPQWVKSPPDGVLVTLNFAIAIKALNHD
ncbi:MAG: DNA mismatch repair endonuclease MutL [Sodalis sp. (in: enterobacteria)]